MKQERKLRNMQIRINDGKLFDIVFIGELMRDGSRIVIELVDNRKFSKIAADFEDVETITMTDSKKPNKKEVYEGFTHLSGIQENKAAGTIRLTLRRP